MPAAPSRVTHVTPLRARVLAFSLHIYCGEGVVAIRRRAPSRPALLGFGRRSESVRACVLM